MEGKILCFRIALLLRVQTLHGVERNAENIIEIDGGILTQNEIVTVARFDGTVHLGTTARQLLEKARYGVEQTVAAGKTVYGINTGFGSLSQKRIPPDAIKDLQRNLIRSHCAGTGEHLPRDVVRAMMLILSASLSRGHSGVRVELVELLLAMLNREVTPIIPSRGSVGASGDLAPLAHLASVLIGEGSAEVKGKTLNGNDALNGVGLEPVTLQSKEGLALINGTHLMSAMATLILADMENLFHAALMATAMSIDACLATDAFLDDRLHEARNQSGQRRVALVLRNLLHGSEIISSHKENDPRVQDPYSLRCSPQVLGAVFDTVEHVKEIVDRELGAVTDNPQVFFSNTDSECTIISGGNFHGMPLAINLDLISIALAHLAGIAERRVYHLLSATDSQNPVNAYLSPEPGLCSGLMIAQYTAAACCNELQTLCVPASVANISTSAGMEDYNSFGPTAAFQAKRAVELARTVVAIELISSAEALEYHRPARSGDGVEKACQLIRSKVDRLTEDRALSDDISNVCTLIEEGKFAKLSAEIPENLVM